MCRMDGRDPEQFPRPFTVGYDTDAEEYYIFAPEGCVLVDGKAATINGVDSSGNVTLDFGQPPNYLWAHVKKASSGDGYEVFFDGEQTKAGAKWNFRVARFSEEENDGDQYDIATSVVSLSSPNEVNVDDKSIDWRIDAAEGTVGGGADEEDDEGKSLEIKGWKTQEASGTTLATALGFADSSSESETSRQVIVRNGVDGSIEYMNLGVVDQQGGGGGGEGEESDDPCRHPTYPGGASSASAGEDAHSPVTVPQTQTTGYGGGVGSSGCCGNSTTATGTGAPTASEDGIPAPASGGYAPANGIPAPEGGIPIEGGIPAPEGMFNAVVPQSRQGSGGGSESAVEVVSHDQISSANTTSESPFSHIAQGTLERRGTAEEQESTEQGGSDEQDV